MAIAVPEQAPGDPILRAMGEHARGEGRMLSRTGWAVTAVVVAFTAADVLVRPSLIVGGQSVELPTRQVQQMLAWTFLAVPAAMYLYFWLPNALRTLIPDLRREGVIAGPKDATTPPIERFEEDARGRYDTRFWVLFAVALIAWYWVVKFRQFEPFETDAMRWQLVLDLIASTPVIYAATVAFGFLVNGIRITNDLFDRYDVRVFPYHPDGAGGFGPLGQRITHLARIGGVAASAAFIINLLSFQAGNDLLRSPETVLGVGVLLVSAPLIMWAWLQGPHRAMLAARGDVLSDVRAVYDRVAREPLGQNEADAEITAHLKKGTDLLVELDRRAVEIVQTYPTWPIHTTELRAVSATVSAPLIAGIIGIVIGAIRQSVGG
jgi:hypothetical protein